jgi:hypothetical protein
MAYDAETDRRIQRMSVQKVAMEAMPPLPVTSKMELGAPAEKWKELFVGLCDWLDEDVFAAGRGVAISAEPATVAPSGNGTPVDILTLDEAMKLTDMVQDACAINDTLKNVVKLQFVKFGIKPGPLGDVIRQLTKPQAKELVELINKEV